MEKDFYTKDFLPNYSVGDYTYGKPAVMDWGDGTTLQIGRYCSIADNVTIILGGNHRADWITTYPFPALHEEWPEAKKITGHPHSKGAIVIENDVWIGFGSTILSGIKIGNGAVIGAQSVVTKDIPAYHIVAGNPAKIVGRRFKKSQIRDLEKIGWWDWPNDIVKNGTIDLCSSNIKGFIKKHAK